MIPLGGTSANLKIDDAIKESLAQSELRAVKVSVDPKAEKISKSGEVRATDDTQNDFDGLRLLVEDAAPCLILFRLDGPKQWALIAWTPDDAPVKMRMLTASSRGTVKGLLEAGTSIIEYACTEADEVTWKKFKESSRELTESEKLASMTMEERAEHEVKKDIAIEQRSAPVKLAGMAKVSAKVSESFESAVRQLVAAEHPRSVAVLAKIEDGTDAIVGELISNVAGPADLKGKLPEDLPTYVLLGANQQSLMLMSWIPPLSKPAKKMKCSTLKGSVFEAASSLVGSLKVLKAEEVFDEDDLSDDIRSNALQKEEARSGDDPMDGGGGSGGYAGGRGGPPPGGFALPGMGVPGRKPPPGAMKLPGM